jgi:hypothetical protein
MAKKLEQIKLEEIKVGELHSTTRSSEHPLVPVVTSVVMLIVWLTLIAVGVFFVGEPDLHDVLLERLSK